MRIVILDGATTNPGDLSWHRLEQMGDVTVYDYTDVDQVVQRCEGAQAVLSNKTPLTREMIEQMDSVQYIGLLSTGYNVVDLEAARERGIVVTNVPSYSTHAVVQHTFALMFALFNHVELHSCAVRQGQWNNPERFCFWLTPLTEAAGKTIGIVGYGRIGQGVARVAEALGMKPLIHTRRKVAEKGIVQMPLEELLSSSDVVSFHCPLT